ncbi:hypothetical protein R3131_003207 [Salmonella enterica]|nr:hypothetical protein [Salmonella enterica]ELR5861386.1 hypothetical protein [Salmonella enterica]
MQTAINQMSQHYDTQTPYILVVNVTPIMNSLPFPRALMGNKKLKKILKAHPYNDKVDSIMNIAFERPQLGEVGEIIEWSLRDTSIHVVVLSNEKAFVKGTYIWLMVVGIIE